MMKNGFYSFAAVVMISLTAACSVIGRNATDKPQNTQQTTSGAAASGVDVKADVPETQRRVGTLFRGNIGESKVELDIKRDGGTLSGSYFYAKSGSANRLTLKGKIEADGSFTMQESDAAGKQTGALKGKWKDDPNEAGASLDGEWLKPGQTADGLSFYAWEQMLYFTSTAMTTREINESIKPKKATLSAEYPELSGGANVQGFNQIVKDRVTRSLTGFKKDLAGLTAADIKMMGEMGTYIEVGYQVEYADDDLISVDFSEDTFLGGAHPNHDTFTLTYDLKQGRELKLADLFKPGSKYLQTIADYAVRDLKDRKDPESGESLGLMTDDIFSDGAKPTADNYKNWNITKKGLLITFPPYQVAAYAYGPQSVMVPYSVLKDIAKPDGMLEKVRK